MTKRKPIPTKPSSRRVPYFFRFYETTAEKVRKCIARMSKNYDIRIKRIAPPKLSVNIFMPPNPLQVDVTFSNKDELDAFKSDDKMTKLYLRANPKGGELVVRKPKDLSWGAGR